jgi:sugar phosphate isomerase/epimerase
MPSRRKFLSTLAAASGAAAVPRRWASSQDEIKTALNGPVGLQLWSLREYLPKNLREVLVKVRTMGFREVEGAGLWGRSAADLRAALDAAGLRCQSAHIPFERLRDDLAGAFAEVKTVGATWVVCPWIPHAEAFSRDDVQRAADAFNKFGTAAVDAGLRFAYHCHGYEFVPSAEGTLFDTLARATDPVRVTFQIDVFHALFGGADPAQLVERYKGRVTSLHLKDLKKGVPIKAGTAIAQPEVDVPVGTGQVDMPSVLQAAMNAATSLYYLEDESSDPWANIPRSLAYLTSFKASRAPVGARV